MASHDITFHDMRDEFTEIFSKKFANAMSGDNKLKSNIIDGDCQNSYVQMSKQVIQKKS